MKITKNILLLFFSFSIPAIGQSSKKNLEAVTLTEVIRFEGITYSGDRIFGITTARERASHIIRDYMQRNKNTQYQLTYRIIYASTIETAINETVFDTFDKLHPRGYKFLTKEEYNAFIIMREDTFEAALWYYMKTKNIAKEKAKKRLYTLYSSYEKYITE
jgi:hypothetical protein